MISLVREGLGMRFGRCWTSWMMGRLFWMLGEVGFEVLEVGTTGGGWGDWVDAEVEKHPLVLAVV